MKLKPETTRNFGRGVVSIGGGAFLLTYGVYKGSTVLKFIPKGLHAMDDCTDMVTQTKSSASPDAPTDYMNCMSDRLAPGPNDAAIALLTVSLAVTALGFGARQIWRGVAYGNLGYRTQKNALTFKLGSEKNEIDARKETPAQDQDDENPTADFRIVNGMNSYAEIMMPPRSVAYSERGAYLSRHSCIEMEPVTAMGEKMLVKTANRIFSGEGLTMVEYRNNSDTTAELRLTPAPHHQVTPIKLEKGQEIFCRDGAFFAADRIVDINLKTIPNLSFQAFGGQGLSMQSIAAFDTPALVLITSDSVTSDKELAGGEKLCIQNECLLAVTGDATLGLKENKGMWRRQKLGESQFETAVTGPGHVWFTTLKPQKPSFLERVKEFDFS